SFRRTAIPAQPVLARAQMAMSADRAKKIEAAMRAQPPRVTEHTQSLAVGALLRGHARRDHKFDTPTYLVRARCPHNSTIGWTQRHWRHVLVLPRTRHSRWYSGGKADAGSFR